MLKTNFLKRNLLLLALLAVFGLNAQTTSSPYSRYGLGDFQFNGFAQNVGMGSGGIGMRNDSILVQYINLSNPASLTSNNIVAYEVGFQSNTTMLQNTTDRSISNRTTLSHIGLAFPVTKWWSGAIGLVPYSSVGYNVSNTEQRDTIGSVTYKYEGSGGIGQVFTAHGFRPFAGSLVRYKNNEKYDLLVAKNDTNAIRKAINLRNQLANISVGAQVSYLFGSLNNVRRDMFPDSAFMLNTRITRSAIVSDVYASYGVQYRYRFKQVVNPQYRKLKKEADSLLCGHSRFKDYFIRDSAGVPCKDTLPFWVRGRDGVQLTFGLVGALPMRVHTTNSILGVTYKQTGTIESVKDTVYSEVDADGTILLPAMYGFGFALKKEYKWLFQADYATQLWENFEFLGVQTSLRNSQRVTAGFQFQPKSNDRRNYFSNVQYRAGFKFYQTYLELNETRLNEMSVSLGFGFQVRQMSRMNLGIELGQRGTTANSLIKENYGRVVLGISLNDTWFQRFRYD